MSKRAGAVPEETKERILSAAREEFLQYGFQGSSLRRICAAAGVTTGALYFFFRGKDDLFETVLSQVTQPFLRLMQAHYQGERQPSRDQAAEKYADFEVSRLLIELYFRDQKTWDILLHHLSHPAVRSFLDGFIERSTDHYWQRLAQQLPEAQPDRFAVHQFVHMQVDTMLTLISHGFTREEMMGHSRTVTKMLQAAFQALLTEEN